MSTDLRPREKLLASGPKALADEELLAICLGTGSARLGVVEFARQLLMDFNGLRGLFQTSSTELLDYNGIGPAKYAQLMAVLELAERHLKVGLLRGPQFAEPQSVRKFLLMKLRDKKREVFVCLFLDNQHRLIEYQELFFGTIDGASVYPREVVREALHWNAAAVIFAHNHPSGIAEPSDADQRITNKLKDALQIMEIRVLDHLVVGDTEVTSFAERGLL